MRICIYFCQAPPDERLEQARKVQQVRNINFSIQLSIFRPPFQLLAALKQPGGGPPVAPAVAPPVTGMPPVPAVQPPPPNPYYPAPPTSAHYAIDPSNPYSAPSISPPAVVPPVTSAPSMNNPVFAGLPPNILAMLQSQGQQQHQPRPPTTPALPSYGMPPPPPSAGLATAQQLMAFLVSFIHCLCSHECS
jgi:hypothetical protein